MLRLGISLIISASLLFLTVRQIDPNQASALLRQTNVSLVLLSILIHFVGYYIRSVRWGLLLSRLKKIPTLQLFPLINIGYMANNVLPFRLGELVRLQLTHQEFHLSRTTVVSTVILERLMDGLTLLSFLIAFVSLSDVPDQYKLSALLFGLVLVLSLALFISLLYLRQSQRAKTLILKIPLINFPIVKESIKSFITGLEALKDPRLVLGSTLTSIVIWMIEALMTYLVAVSVNLPVNYTQIIFLTAVINLSTIIPSAPGYFGTFEFFTYQALSLFGIEKSQAATFAALVHLIQWAPVTLVGFLYTFRYHLSWKSLKLKDPA